MAFFPGFRQAFLLRSFMYEQPYFHHYENECRYECTFFRRKESCEDEEYADCQSERQHDLTDKNDDGTSQAQDEISTYERNDGISGICPNPGKNVGECFHNFLLYLRCA